MKGPPIEVIKRSPAATAEAAANPGGSISEGLRSLASSVLIPKSASF